MYLFFKKKSKVSDFLFSFLMIRMSEFYELVTPDLFLHLQKLDLFPMECMICYDECNQLSPIVLFPCFHIMHLDCANKTIEMSFKNAIHPNTILETWEFHCPQRDSSESLGERERRIKNSIGRDIRPPVPRCGFIPIPDRIVDEINYFSIPYVKQWYQSFHANTIVYQEEQVEVINDSKESTFFILFRFVLLLLCMFYLPSSVWLGIIIYAICYYYSSINEILSDENRIFRLLVTGIVLYASYANE
jgi:hypothetical protein